MATWIVHLRLADELLRRIDGLDAAQFAVGSVAPDSGIPDENWEKFDPPPEITHFQRGADKRACADMDFFREYLLPLRGAECDAARLSFLLGYFFHLITDNLWNQQVGRPTRERFAAQFDADPRFIWEVKRDWYGLDFAHVHANPESLFWRVFLGAEYPQSYLDFMPPEAIRRNLAYIKEFYQRRDDDVETRFVQRPNLYLSQEAMDTFVTDATARLRAVYREVWEHGTAALVPHQHPDEKSKGD